MTAARPSRTAQSPAPSLRWRTPALARHRALLAPQPQRRAIARMCEQALLELRRAAREATTARIRKMVVGITGSNAPITPRPTITQPSANQSQRISAVSVRRRGTSVEFRFDMAVHAAERGIGGVDHLLFLLGAQRNRVQRSGELAPVARGAIRMRGQVAGAEITIQPSLAAILYSTVPPRLEPSATYSQPRAAGSARSGGSGDVRAGSACSRSADRGQPGPGGGARPGRAAARPAQGWRTAHQCCGGSGTARAGNGRSCAVGEDVAGHDALVQGSVTVAGGGLEP